jgi:hypothetical protein
MPEPRHVQTNIVDEPELDPATVIFWNGRHGWARTDRSGPDVYLGVPELLLAGIEQLKIGTRLVFEVRKATHGRKPWAARIRLLDHA